MKISYTIVVVTIGLLASGCEVEDPVKEAVPELITQVTLTFTPSDGSPVVVTATDPDGEGVQDIVVEGPVFLEVTKSYGLSITLTNGLAQPTDPEYDITEEVREEGDEHIFFYAWTNNVFADPEGDGNLDNRDGPINYQDEDENGLPIGLETSWTSGSAASGSFRVVLKHQPDLKSETSDSSEGDTDLDITFSIEVQ